MELKSDTCFCQWGSRRKLSVILIRGLPISSVSILTRKETGVLGKNPESCWNRLSLSIVEMQGVVYEHFAGMTAKGASFTRALTINFFMHRFREFFDHSVISIDPIAGTSIHIYLFGTACVDEATSFPGSLFFFPSPSARKRESASEREVESLGTTLPRTQENN